MRWTWLFLGLALAGCVEDSPEIGTHFGQMPLEIYQLSWPGGDLRVEGSPFMVGLVITNPTDAVVSYGVGKESGQAGFITDAGIQDEQAGTKVLEHAVVHDTLGPGERRLWLVERGEVETADMPTVGVVFVFEGDRPVAAREVLAFGSMARSKAAVEPGMHVLTATVGFWTNGTSFYTNIPELLEDPAFPAGGNIDREAALASAAPLPIYVYDQDRSEQPDGSIDTCHFTTIPGYNTLLKTQHEGTTGVRFLRPEEGYTRDGNEDHLLYGDALVFFNTIVEIEGTTDDMDALPDPQGDCFDVDRYTPDPIPDVTAA